MTWDLGYGVEEIEISTEGTLAPGQPNGGRVGFQASTVTETIFLKDDDSDDEDPVDQFVKAYPCSHVPVPTDW
jgi:hypothetical protein